MAAQAVTGGFSSYCNFGYESSYGNAATGTRVFGHGTKLTINRKNNMDRVFGLGARNASATVAKKYEGTASVEFLLSHGDFFRGVLGTVADGGATPWSHTYSEADDLQSFSITNGAELGSADYVSVLTGCKVSTCTITSAIDAPVTVKLECPYKTETLATSGISSQVAPSEDVFTFAQGTLSIGGTINYVQSIDLTINNNLEILWGLGSRIATAAIGKVRHYDFKMSVAFSDVTALLTKFLGASGAPHTTTPAAQATLILTFTNGLSGSDERSIVMTFANFYINEDSLPLDVNEVVKEDVTGWAHSCTSIIWENDTEVDEGNP